MKKKWNWFLVVVVLGTGAALGITKLTSVAIQNSTIDSTVIGAVSAAAAHFSYSQATSNLSPVPSQGAWTMWNLSGGGGETDFVNSRGNGVGGFNWYNTSSALSTPIATLSAGGNLALTGNLSSAGTGYFTGAVTATTFNGNVQGGSVAALNGLFARGTFGPPSGNITQIGWNQTGSGESDFFNQSGSGAGGFNWYWISGNTISGSPGSPLMTLDDAGNLTGTGRMTAPNGFYGALYGNATTATTATQLANTPGNCGAGSYMSGLTANGTKSCTPTGIESVSVGGCSTASGSYSECSVTVTLPTAYADANYQASCTPVGAGSGYVSYTGTSSKSSSGFVVGIATSGGQSASVSGFDCITHHN